MKVKKFASMASVLSSAAAAILPIGRKVLPLSLLATVSLQAATITLPGKLTYEFYPGGTRGAVEAGSAGAPSLAGSVTGNDLSGLIDIFESGTNFAESYANRISGLFIPDTTGNYVFFIAADDDSDLFLSTDENPANKKLIAQEPGWSGVRKYNTIGGGTPVEAKRSDAFAGSQWPGAAGAGATIKLTKGQKYYIEAVHHEGGGGDNVAVTYKLDTEADPADDDAPRLTGSVIAAIVPTGTPAVTVAPQGGTAYAGLSFSMFVVDNSAGAFPVFFQWKKDGADIPGAKGPKYTIGSAKAADAGSYTVVLSAYKPDGTLGSVTSAPAVVTVKTVPVEFAEGFLQYDYFPGSDRASVEAGTAGSPSTAGSVVGSDLSGLVSIAESGTNFAEGYANRLSGLFIPPATGNYIFLIAADDDSDLFLSTDETAANKKLIAQEAGWSGVRKYATVGGGSSTENKRSDSFSSTEWPDGNTIKLTKGQKYYIEAVHHEGGGGDNLAVTYKLDTESEDLVADDTEPRLKGAVIGTSIPRIMSVSVGAVTDKKLTFSVTDSGASVLDPTKVKVLFDGQPVTATAGAKVGTRTDFTLAFPAALAFGSTHYYFIEATDVQGNPVAKTAPFTLGFPYFPTANLPGPAAVNDAWSYEFIFAVKDAGGNNTQITGLPSIMKILAASGDAGFKATIVKGTSATVNWNAGGFLPDGASYPDEAANSPDWNGEDFININIANINVPEEADYTFGFHSDDGFAFRIRGATALSVAGNGALDPLDPEATVHPADTGDSSTRAVYHLKKGIYRVEFFWWERGGGDHGETYVAKGVFKNDADTDTWLAVGDPASAIKLTSAAPTFPEAGGDKPTASVSSSANGVTITSSNGGTVQASDSLTSPNWTDIGSAPQTVQKSGSKRFFRIKK